ncbi:MAG: NAD+ synthase [Phycisphaerales bacterium]|nr:NAD+ synthase [Phycisphaerales bacterium]
MRLGLLRLDPTIGDLASIDRIVTDACQEAFADGLDVVVAPELALCGYPPRDLLHRQGFVEACAEVMRSIASTIGPDRLLLLGAPWMIGGRLTNALVACSGGEVIATGAKRLLPAYDVFDEDRWFTPGDRSCIVPFSGRRLGLLVCEDMWQGGDVGAPAYESDPVADAIDAGADLLVVASASPFAYSKHALQRRRLQEVAAQRGVDVVAVNQGGANDDLIFDGAAMAVAADGRWRAIRGPFDCGQRLDVDLDSPNRIEPADVDEDALRVGAIIASIEGYVRKTGASGVLLGLSGGIDSALVAALAVAALGPERVDAITMPGRYTSTGTRDDAQSVASALGIRMETLGIEPVHSALRQVLGGASVEDGSLVDQNLQARARGVLLMARSNASGALVLATGNKSELAVGYATLYGDMNGALCPLGDLLKTDVQAMSRWLNVHHDQVGLNKPPIPESVISRPPSAELRPDQTDQDSLPPYPVLDALVRAIVEDQLDDEEAAQAAGVETDEAAHWRAQIDRAQFKRSQAAVIPKLSARAFGPGRPWPIVARLTRTAAEPSR